MIRIGHREVTGVTVLKKAVAAVYWGAALIWQAVRSCFGTGTWRGDRPWLGSDKWKNE